MLVTFLWIGTTFAFFNLLGNLPLSKQDWKINFKGLQIKSSQIFTILILITSWPWALFGSRFLIIFRISLFEKSIVVSDSRVFFLLFFFERERGREREIGRKRDSVAGSSHLFLSIEHRNTDQRKNYKYFGFIFEIYLDIIKVECNGFLYYSKRSLILTRSTSKILGWSEDLTTS